MNDHALLSAVQGGDRAAFERLVRENQRAVYGYLRTRLPQSTDVEKLTQVVFVRACQSQARLDVQTLARPWLLGIARDMLSEHRPKGTARDAAWTNLCLELETLPDEAIDRSSATSDRLPICLEGLGPTARDVLDLRFRDEIKLDEIATRLKRSEAAVRLLIFRARQALRSCLDANSPVADD